MEPVPIWQELAANYDQMQRQFNAHRNDPVTAENPNPWIESEATVREAFLRRLGALLHGLESASTVTRVQTLRKIATTYPGKAPFASELLRVVCLEISGVEPSDLEGSARTRRRVLRLWTALESYLGKFFLGPGPKTFSARGIDPTRLYQRLRDAAWFERNAAIAARFNGFLVDTRWRPAVDAITHEAWFNHLHILDALGDVRGLETYVEWLGEALRAHGLHARLQELRTWIDGWIARREAEPAAQPAVTESKPAVADSASTAVEVEPQPPSSTPLRSGPIRFEDLPDVLTAQQVGKFLQVSDKTIYEWSRKGRLPQLAALGRNIRFAKAEVFRFLESQPSKAKPKLRGGGLRYLQ